MLENFVERIKQYPAKEQVELKVLVKVPGSWFPGNLTAEEKRQRYEAQAADWAQAKAFKKVGSRPAQTCAAVKFLCESDVVDEPEHVKSTRASGCR